MWKWDQSHLIEEIIPGKNPQVTLSRSAGKCSTLEDQQLSTDQAEHWLVTDSYHNLTPLGPSTPESLSSSGGSVPPLVIAVVFEGQP